MIESHRIKSWSWAFVSTDDDEAVPAQGEGLLVGFTWGER